MNDAFRIVISAACVLVVVVARPPLAFASNDDKEATYQLHMQGPQVAQAANGETVSVSGSGMFSGKPRVQSDAPDSSLGEILLRGCNQRATNSVTTHCPQYHQGKNSAGGIVMLIAWVRDCTDHPAHFAITHRHKRATTLIGSDSP